MISSFFNWFRSPSPAPEGPARCCVCARISDHSDFAPVGARLVAEGDAIPRISAKTPQIGDVACFQHLVKRDDDLWHWKEHEGEFEFFQGLEEPRRRRREREQPPTMNEYIQQLRTEKEENIANMREGQRREERLRHEAQALRDLLAQLPEKAQDLQLPIAPERLPEGQERVQAAERVTTTTPTPMRLLLNRSAFVSQRPCDTPADIAKEKKLCKLWFGTSFLPELIAAFPPDTVSRTAHRNASYTPLEQFLIGLVWLRREFSLEAISDLACIEESSVRAYRDRTVDAIMQSLFESHVSLPTGPEWEGSHSSPFKKRYPGTLMYFTGGTVISMPQPQAIDAFNNEQRMASLTFSILVTEAGRIVWISKVTDGCLDDATAWSASDINEKLDLKYRHFANANPRLKLAICGDEAYPCINIPSFFHVYVPKTAQETIDAAENLQPPENQIPAGCVAGEGENLLQGPLRNRFKRADATCRTLCNYSSRWCAEVERVFRRFKTWTVLSDSDAMSSDQTIVQKYVHSIAALENFDHLQKMNPDE